MKRFLLPLLACGISSSLMAQTSPQASRAHELTMAGFNLMTQGKFDQVLAKFDEAESADPLSSEPFSGRADFYFSLSQRVKPELKDQYRQHAADLASMALKRNAADVIANEVMRQLQDGGKDRYTPTAQARAVLDEGELLFSKQDYDAALKKYEEASKLDPHYADPLVYAGDCFFSQGKMAEAESYFRRATIVDPLEKKAWRYLADALARQHRIAEAREALFGAIAALPTYLPAWDNLGQVWPEGGVALRRFHYQTKAGAKFDEKANQRTVILDPSLTKGYKEEGLADMPAWVMFGISLSNAQAAASPAGPFEQEAEAWTNVAKVLKELSEKGDVKITDPVIVQMNQFVIAGDLKPALFLLAYKEVFRPDFEAWKKENPDGVKKFIAQYGMRP